MRCDNGATAAEWVYLVRLKCALSRVSIHDGMVVVAKVQFRPCNEAFNAAGAVSSASASGCWLNCGKIAVRVAAEMDRNCVISKISGVEMRQHRRFLKNTSLPPTIPTSSLMDCADKGVK